MRVFLVIALIAVSIVVGGAWFVYSRVSYQPGWYESGGAWTPPEGSAARTFDRVRRELSSQRRTSVDASDLEALVAHTVRDRLGAAPDAIVKGLRTDVGPEGASIEGVVDLTRFSDRPPPGIPPEIASVATDILPSGLLENLYVKIDLPPGNTASLRESAVVTVGRMQFPLAEIASELEARGMSLDGMLPDGLRDLALRTAGDRLVVSR